MRASCVSRCARRPAARPAIACACSSGRRRSDRTSATRCASISAARASRWTRRPATAPAPGAPTRRGSCSSARSRWCPACAWNGYLPTGAVSLDPRLAARWEPSRTWFAKGYLGLYHQPPDFGQWDENLGNPRLRVPYALQAGTGGGRVLGEDTRVEAELFYKWLDDLVVDTPDDPNDPEDLARPSNEGIGRAYGAELRVKRGLTGRLYGWIAYTLSRSERADPYTRGGWHPFEYDQTHIFTALAGYLLPRGWELGVRLRYATGNPTTFNDGGVYEL